jgi:uncharacterized protein YecT (DUF1311 family)
VRRVSTVFLGVAALVSCLGARAQFARGAPQGPCHQYQTQLELTRCWNRVAEDAERRLAGSYNKVLGRIRQSGPDGASALLQAAQTKWQAYRSAQCAITSKLYDGGSIESMQRASCRARLADHRRDELESMLADWRGGE